MVRWVHRAVAHAGLNRPPASAPTAGVIGVIYFDAETDKCGDNRPQDSAALLAAFRRATSPAAAASPCSHRTSRSMSSPTSAQYRPSR